MLLKRLAGIIVLLMLVGSACFAQKAKLVADNIALCPRAQKPPVIDGMLDDACWRSGPRISGFTSPDGSKPPREQTEVYMAYDKRGLYLAFRCHEPEMSKLKTSEKEFVWRNDALELFIDANRDRRAYQHFALSADGGKYQATQMDAGADRDPSWTAPWQAAVHLGENEWTAEIFYPASTIGLVPRDGIAMRANFTRSERGLPEQSTWNPLSGGWHQPLEFGNIVLGGRRLPLTAEIALPAEIRPGKVKAQLLIANKGRSAVSVVPKIVVIPSKGYQPPVLSKTTVAAGGSVRRDILLMLPDVRKYNVDVFLQTPGRAPEFAASYGLTLAPSLPDAVGWILACPDWGTVWEACATFKVMPETKPPTTSLGRTVSIRAAKNEFEPFQIVLTPSREIKNLRASASDLTGRGVIPREKISIKLVETVPVTMPTSPDCLPGDYPDPLPPFEPTSIPAGRNTSLWLTVYVPTDARAGDYIGTVTLEADGIAPVRIPVKLHVWDFALPKVSFLRTAYAYSLKALTRWHGVSGLEAERKTLDLLNRDFAEHRIAPQEPVQYYDWDEEWSGGEVKIDFTEWDAGASKYLPGLNSFRLPGSFMGGIGRLSRGDSGYREMKTKFLKAFAAHLREKGWLGKGYDYIFDEPDPPEYPMIVEEAKIWHEADPGLKVLLTEAPEKELIGSVDIWTPVLDAYIEKPCKERQKAGEEVWWYVCCGPLHPYPNNFIDYPAIDPRIFHWMTWRYGVTGVLYWHTMFWSDNPYTTAMSHSDDGSRKPLGNGDGRFLYPATRQRAETPLIAGPVDSIRWEMLREGVEDYDYFYMLRYAVTKAEASGRKDGAVSEAKKSLAQVDMLIRSRTDYETHPVKLYAVRKRVGDALEKLVGNPSAAH